MADFGFMNGRGTSDAVFILRRLTEKYWLRRLAERYCFIIACVYIYKYIYTPRHFIQFYPEKLKYWVHVQ